ncbi:hypothetical protein QJS66_23680 (plasmid) [Kocuria rhizophila]|nr:hypothetical protein QJS66_23680 [Kocuria rhizophila]
MFSAWVTDTRLGDHVDDGPDQRAGVRAERDGPARARTAGNWTPPPTSPPSDDDYGHDRIVTRRNARTLARTRARTS